MQRRSRIAALKAGFVATVSDRALMIRGPSFGALYQVGMNPQRIARSRRYIISPQTLYECVGDVPNVVFPCATLCDVDTGRLAIYYGGADTVVALAFGYVEDLIDFAKADSLV